MDADHMSREGAAVLCQMQFIYVRKITKAALLASEDRNAAMCIHEGCHAMRLCPEDVLVPRPLRWPLKGLEDSELWLWLQQS